MSDTTVSYGHAAAFFLLTFGIRLLPPGGRQRHGHEGLGVFLGLLYGWSFIGFAWPSMISLVALGFTGYGDPARDHRIGL